jgi:hypothetical protein
MNMPKWLDELLADVCDACVNDAKGRMSGLSCRWAKPEDNTWGAWLLVVAPAVVELAGGKDDGKTVFDFVDVNLLALPGCLDEVESFDYNPAYGDRPHIALIGRKGKREVVVEIYFEPFEDDEPQKVFDVRSGGWRDARPDKE